MCFNIFQMFPIQCVNVFLYQPEAKAGGRVLINGVIMPKAYKYVDERHGDPDNPPADAQQSTNPGSSEQQGGKGNDQGGAGDSGAHREHDEVSESSSLLSSKSDGGAGSDPDETYYFGSQRRKKIKVQTVLSRKN